jgi:uncharacterized protein (TIRG00374 family)
LKSKLVLLAKLAVATGFLYYLLRSGQLDLGRLVDRLSEPGSWVWIVATQGLVFSILYCCAIRWYLLLRAQGIQYRLREIFSLTMIGFFFNQFVPGSTGGDLVKAYYVATERRDLRAAGITTVALDRVIGMVVLVGMAGGAILFNLTWIRTDPYLHFLAGFIAAGLLIFFVASLLFFNERLRRVGWLRAAVGRLPFQAQLRNMQESVYLYREYPGTILLVVALSCCVQVSVVLASYFLYLALGGGEVGLVSFFFLVPIAHLAMAVPISPPGGLGVGEWAFAELFRKVGYADGGLIALLQRINWYLWAFAGAVCFLGKRKSVRRAIALAHAADDLEHEDTAPGLHVEADSTVAGPVLPPSVEDAAQPAPGEESERELEYEH